jgi:dihydrofolate reductase
MKPIVPAPSRATERLAVTGIAVIARNGIMANGDNIPWEYLREELEGRIVVCDPGTQPYFHSESLPDQPTFVVSAESEYNPSIGTRVDTFYWAFNQGSRTGLTRICLFGGEAVFNEALAYCDEFILIRLDSDFVGTDEFPEEKLSVWHHEVSVTPLDSSVMDCAGTVTRYQRTEKKTLWVYPRNARNLDYWADLVAINTLDQCPFCEGGTTLTMQGSIMENEGWYVIHNAHPSDVVEYQFVLIPKVERETHWPNLLKPHPRYRTDLSDRVRGQLLQDIERKIKEKFGITDCLLTWREGDETEAIYMGSSVFHVHVQLHVIFRGKLLQLYFGIRSLDDPIPE